MQRVSHGEKIDLTDWNFSLGGLLGDLPNKIAGGIVTPVLRQVFEEDPPRIGLPVIFAGKAWSPPEDGIGGPPVDNPLTLDVYVPLAEPESDGVTYRTTLAELIHDELLDEICGVADDDTLLKVVAELERLAQRLRLRACHEESKQRGDDLRELKEAFSDDRQSPTDGV